MGLMQLMPQTARELRVKNAFNPEPNGDAGVPHLRYLLENYNGAVNLTLAAYNAGEGPGVPHCPETWNYGKRITNLYYRGYDLTSSGTSKDPVRVQRDARGVFYISNTDSVGSICFKS